MDNCQCQYSVLTFLSSFKICGMKIEIKISNRDLKSLAKFLAFKILCFFSY